VASGPLVVEVDVIDRAGGSVPRGASLVIGEARIVAR
jgi:hypothetical protein